MGLHPAVLNSRTRCLGALTLSLAIVTTPMTSGAQRIQAVAFAPAAADVEAPATANATGIWKHSRTRKGNAWKGAKVGALVGLIALPTGIYLAERSCEDYCFTLLAMAIGAPVGAIAGAGVGAGLGALWWEPPTPAKARQP